MKRTISTTLAGCVAAAWLAAGSWAGEPPNLCATVEDAVRLLAENGMAPSDAAAPSALARALVASADPTAEFLDDAGLAEWSGRGTAREWHAGLALVAGEGHPKVASVGEGSPAAAAGILPGEFIASVGGVELEDGALTLRALDLLAGGDEASVEVGVVSEDGETRREVVLERVKLEGERLAVAEELPAGIGYVRVEGLYPGTGERIAEHLDGWLGTDSCGVVLDLRGADGMAAEEVPVVAARFAPLGSFLYEKTDRLGREVSAVEAGAEPAATMPTMVLVDEGTSGAAELLAAVLAGSVRGAMLIGRETSGDPMIREPLGLATGGHALVAIRQLRTADGKTYDGSQGVRPDVPITDAALRESVYEPASFALRPGKTPSEEEKVDKALRERIRHDTYLRRASDVLLGLQALGYGSPAAD
jgi:carboxyl-terminal processing protease